MTTFLIFILIVIAIAVTLVAKGVRFVPQQHSWVVERLGRYSRTLEPGLNIIIPIIDRIAYKFDLRETPIEVEKQVCITKDNTQIAIDGILYMQITDSKSAAYGTSDPMTSVEQLAQTVMRSDVGKKQLDEVLSSRKELNESIVSELDSAATNWGVKVLRYEIRDIRPPNEVVRAMELQITAEREKRAMIAKSEGERQQAINVAEGKRQSKILQAEGNAKAILLTADASAEALRKVGESLKDEGAMDAMRMKVAQDFIERWGGIAKSSNVMIVPSDMGDLSKTVGTAFKIVDGMKKP